MDLLTPMLGCEDTDDSRAIKIALVISLPFFISLFKSCDDLGYRFRGKTAAGTVSSIAEHRSPFGMLEGYDVSYTFVNANTMKQVNGYTLVGEKQATDYFVGQKLDIQYRGDDIFSSRIKGTGGWFWQTFFVVSLIAAVAFVVIMTIRTSRRESS